MLEVEFNCATGEIAVGDATITCQEGTHFIYSKTPRCLPKGRKIIVGKRGEYICSNVRRELSKYLTMVDLKMTSKHSTVEMSQKLRKILHLTAPTLFR